MYVYVHTCTCTYIRMYIRTCIMCKYFLGTCTCTVHVIPQARNFFKNFLITSISPYEVMFSSPGWEDGVWDEENGSVVAHQVPVVLLRVELDSKTSRISYYVCTPTLPPHTCHTSHTPHTSHIHTHITHHT